MTSTRRYCWRTVLSRCETARSSTTFPSEPRVLETRTLFFFRTWLRSSTRCLGTSAWRMRRAPPPAREGLRDLRLTPAARLAVGLRGARDRLGDPRLRLYSRGAAGRADGRRLGHAL